MPDLCILSMVIPLFWGYTILVNERKETTRMTTKEMIKEYSPKVLDYVNNLDEWKTVGEIASCFNLNIMEMSMVLSNLNNQNYIQKRTNPQGVTVYGNFRLSVPTKSKSFLDKLFKR